MTRVRITEDNILSVLQVSNWVLLSLMVVAGLFLGSVPLAGSILAGGLLAILNYHWLLSVLIRVLQLPVKEAGRFAQVRFVLRMTILAFILWSLITHVGISITGLLLGLSITVINIIILAFYKVVCRGD